MLKSLKINNYALIQELDIQFDPGFSTLTGETGAGKSILLGALALALGNRADTTAISGNNDKCIVEACFNIAAFHLQKSFEELDIDYNDLTIIRREITSSGKSRAFINDTPVNLNDLKTLSTQLIDIHSQHENLALNNSQFQLNVLDAAAKNQKLLTQYKTSFKTYQLLKTELETLESKAREAASNHEFNQFQFNQINEIKLENMKLDELENELEILNNTEEIQLNLGTAFGTLSNSDANAIDLLKQAKAAFDRIKSYYPQAEDYSNRIESSIIDLSDIASETETAAETMEYNPERAQLLKESLDKLYSLFQKHQCKSISELINHRNELERELIQEESYEHAIVKIRSDLQKQTSDLQQLANELAKNRKKASDPLCQSIITLLADLGMPNTRFIIDLQETESFNENGKNTINFLFSANKNLPPQNIAKIASGGEISRLMLSIKYILSQSVSLPTIIFDEIDTGVSGEIADKMANIMQQMSKKMQVISITHLPQIAAKGQTHYKVFKLEQNNIVSTQIIRLSTDERINEIAKMLSGSSITNQAIENAKSLIALSN